MASLFCSFWPCLGNDLIYIVAAAEVVAEAQAAQLRQQQFAFSVLCNAAAYTIRTTPIQSKQQLNHWSSVAERARNSSSTLSRAYTQAFRLSHELSAVQLHYNGRLVSSSSHSLVRALLIDSPTNTDCKDGRFAVFLSCVRSRSASALPRAESLLLLRRLGSSSLLSCQFSCVSVFHGRTSRA